MAKQPAFQFYPADWLKDPSLQMCSYEVKGIWIDLLCCLWESDTRGRLQGTKADFIRLLGCKPKIFDNFLKENRAKKFANVIQNGDGITIENRRMIRDEQIREAWRIRKQRERDKSKDVTP